MPEVTQAVNFDPNEPVYVVKSFFFGANLGSIRHASDHPLRLDQIPADKRTSEYIKQGRMRSNIPTMMISEENNGIQIDSGNTVAAVVNPLDLEVVLDSQGEALPASAPTALRRAAKNKQLEASQKAAPAPEPNSKNNSSK